MIKNICSMLILFFMFLNFNGVSAQSSDSSNGFNKPILDSNFKFEAELKNGDVFMYWKEYNKDEKLKYYKIVRSATNDDPVYPDDGYIKYSSDKSFTDYVDLSPLSNTSYYRICAITYENNRYCSKVVKVHNDKKENVTMCTMDYSPVCGYKDGTYKTYSNKCMLNADGAYKKYYGECEDKVEIKYSDYGLSNSLKEKSNKLVFNLIRKLDKSDITNETRLSSVNSIIDKLDGLKGNKPNLENLIDYIIDLLNEKKTKYEDDFSEIEDIFNLD